MFKKIGQVKLQISFLCIPANFNFVAVRTGTMNVKTKHITVGLSNCRTAGPVLTPLSQYSSYIMATPFSGGRSRNTRSEPPTMGKQLVNFMHSFL
jgi:hypothetical protein